MINKNNKNDIQRQSKKAIHTEKMPEKQTCKYCGSSHPETLPSLWKEMYIQTMAKSVTSVGCVGGTRVMNEFKKETAQDGTEESSIDSVNINSIHTNKNCSVITANLKHQQVKIV